MGKGSDWAITVNMTSNVEPLPGLDVARGLDLWGDAKTYRQYLRKFADDYACSVVTMRAVLANNQPSVAAALAHKMKGSAANLALLDVSQQAAVIERELTAGAVTADLSGLQEAVATALVSINCYASAAASGAGVAAPLDRVQADLLAPRFLDLLQALDSGYPERAEPLLDELAAALPVGQLQPLLDACLSFDFDGAVIAARKLAQSLGISLEA